jgi:hypothetical protein
MDRKRKIEALLPLVSADRSAAMRRELRALNARLGFKDKLEAKDLLAQPIEGAAGVNGVGGLYFQAQSPPGQGRLVRIPFYLFQLPTTFPANVITAAGAGLPSATNPLVIAQIPYPAGGPSQRFITGMQLQTPIIEWGRLRVVGFQAYQNPFVPTGVDGSGRLATIFRPFLLVKHLIVGGGANLFSQEGYVDAGLFSPRVPEFAGLRGYPLLESPNRAFVSAAVSGLSDATVFAQLTSVTFSLNLIAEVLDDTMFGSHIPGPYARRDAMLRTPSPDGRFTRK